ncbi:MAG TPA: hypothetical protein V6C95_09735 [Coleofasciculaceae cyanobacterium]
MTNLTKYQEVEIAEIVIEASEAIPLKYQHQLLEAVRYLAYCSVIEQSEAPLIDIQTLINNARLDNNRQLDQMTQQINSEISSLRGEMRSGFIQVTDALVLLNNRQDLLESRVNQLESTPQQTVIVNNTYHGTVPKELVIIAALTTLVGLLVLQQSMNVRDTWYLQNRQEVQR